MSCFSSFSFVAEDPLRNMPLVSAVQTLSHSLVASFQLSMTAVANSVAHKTTESVRPVSASKGDTRSLLSKDTAKKEVRKAMRTFIATDEEGPIPAWMDGTKDASVKEFAAVALKSSEFLPHIKTLDQESKCGRPFGRVPQV